MGWGGGAEASPGQQAAGDQHRKPSEYVRPWRRCVCVCEGWGGQHRKPSSTCGRGAGGARCGGGAGAWRDRRHPRMPQHHAHTAPPHPALAARSHMRKPGAGPPPLAPASAAACRPPADLETVQDSAPPVVGERGAIAGGQVGGAAGARALSPGPARARDLDPAARAGLKVRG